MGNNPSVGATSQLDGCSLLMNVDPQEYENVRSQMHTIRIQNADNRAKINTLNRQKLELEAKLLKSSKTMSEFKAEY